MTAQPLAAAAAELGVNCSTLRRWVRRGCPVARRGGGRGRLTLVDIEAVRAWRRQGDDVRGDFAREIAGKLPELVGDAIAEAHRVGKIHGERDPAWYCCAAWQKALDAVTNRLRDEVPDLPDATAIPASIEQLRQSVKKGDH